MAFQRLGLASMLVVGAVSIVAACSSTVRNNTFDEQDSAVDPNAGDSGGTDGPSLLDPDSASTGNCPEGSETKITGKVYDPAGKNPLYNIQVFIPSGELPEIKTGLPAPKADGFCPGQTCDSEVLNPVAAALTNTKGEFELKGPRLFPGKDVPVVMQIGKWRRKIIVPEVKACETTKLDASNTRLPKNGTEGDMPQIFMAIGGCDALECLLTGIGIDRSEFEAGFTGTGKHIHVFAGDGGPTTADGRAVPAAGTVWTSASNMRAYDIAMLGCECDYHAENKGNIQGMRDFANAGGRVFATHFHAAWMKNNSSWANGIIDFNSFTNATGNFPVNTTLPNGQPFPKGQALADWLFEVGASPTVGQINIPSSNFGTPIVQNGLAPSSPAQEWIGKGSTGRYYSFNTPVGIKTEEQCGRFVFSDIHSNGSGGGAYLSKCSASLSAVQQALEFMFFDLSSCVQDETKPPVVPK